MGKAVLISIRPEWVEKILSGKKTLEVRKTRPKLETPFKCYIYCTKPKRKYEDYIVTEWDDCFDWPNEGFFGGGLVVGEFVCDVILPIQIECSSPAALEAGIEVPGTCLTDRKILEYLGNGKQGYAWHISDLKIYDTPKGLTGFHTWKKCKSCSKSGYESTACVYDGNCIVPAVITKAPQSWCYVEELT